MPIIKSAKKKLRKDQRRTKGNEAYRRAYKRAFESIKKMKKGVEKAPVLKKAYAAIDKAVKKGIIHKNKGSRLKSQVSKMVNK